MSDTKLKDEITRMQREVELIQQAITTEKACGELASFITSKPDAFAGDGENPWTSAPPSGGGCCEIS